MISILDQVMALQGAMGSKKNPDIRLRKILEFLQQSDNGMAYTQDLIPHLGLKRVTVSVLFRELDSLGYVRRVTNRQDLRHIYQITEKGKEWIQF